MAANEVAAVVRDGWFAPFSREDADAARGLEDGQVVRIKFVATKKERSLCQLRLFWALCRTVAANTDDPNWNHKDKVAEQIKLELRHIDYRIVHGDLVHIKTKSIGFAELDHLEACRFFDRAFVVMAEKLGVDVDDLVCNAEF